MLTSVRWINEYLDPPATAEEQATLATRAGFPLEGTEEVAVSDGTDIRQDFEMASNRGDCVSHFGLAREIAAISGRTLKPPVVNPPCSGRPVSELVNIENREPVRCPLYTGRVILGATIGPSPAWLADRLLARGDIPRNNVVDATNFVLFELGQPTHIFDLNTLKDRKIIVRMAVADEPFLPIGEGESEVALTPNDLVIADAEHAVAIAGVKGGALSAVTDGTTDLLLEAASFDPVAVRTTSRRHNIFSDSSYRFERGVAPGQVAGAADRLAALILEVAGGELCHGVVSDGAPIPDPRRVTMRTERCRKILGVPVADDQMIDGLARLGFAPTLQGATIECVVPVHRLDIEREIDLVEEVGRMFGLDSIPVHDTIAIRVAPPQASEQGRQAVAYELAGLGFVETVTHSIIACRDAEPFLLAGDELMRFDDDRAEGGVLQPSTLPGLLRVRRHNHDSGVDHLRLFESAATFRVTSAGDDEAIRLGLLMDVDDEARGLRPLRGVVERLVEVLLGRETALVVDAGDTPRWLDPGARVKVNGDPIGWIGRLAADVGLGFGLDAPVLVAELELTRFYDGYPPIAEAKPLPAFPAIERDLSPIVDGTLAWNDVARTIDGLDLDHLDSCDFVTTFRGDSVGAGKKSLTLRLRFRATDRTLTHDEVDPQVATAVRAVKTAHGATFRTG